VNKRSDAPPPRSRKKLRSDESLLFTERRPRPLSDRDRDHFLAVLLKPPAPTTDLVTAAARHKGKPKLNK